MARAKRCFIDRSLDAPGGARDGSSNGFERFWIKSLSSAILCTKCAGRRAWSGENTAQFAWSCKQLRGLNEIKANGANSAILPEHSRQENICCGHPCSERPFGVSHLASSAGPFVYYLLPAKAFLQMNVFSCSCPQQTLASAAQERCCCVQGADCPLP